MIPLDDPIWHQLRCHNVTGQEFAAILQGYYTGPIPTGAELDEDLLQVICGGEVYDSSIAAAPHLIHLASRCDPAPAATMLRYAAMAIAEAGKEGGARFDPRLIEPLREAACAGVIEAMSVLESPGLDCLSRDEMEAALLAFSGDVEGYRESMERINEWLDAWFDRPEQTEQIPAPGPRLEVTWDHDLPSSRTSNSGE